MTTALNKKVLCFVDEYGTAGQADFHLGAVLVLAREAGRIDRRFSDLLELSANEIHASALEDSYLLGLLERFHAVVPTDRIVMVNVRPGGRAGTAPVLYAQALVETVKVGLRRFQKDVLRRDTIGNVEVITDQNHHNTHPEFKAEIARALREDGRFRGVKQVVCLDSAASRLLQLADLVAYSRKWALSGDLGARALGERFGIELS